MERLKGINIQTLDKKHEKIIQNRFDLEKNSQMINFDNSYQIDNKLQNRELSEYPLKKCENNNMEYNEKIDNYETNNNNNQNNLNNTNNINNSSVKNYGSNQPILLLNDFKEGYPIIENKYYINPKENKNFNSHDDSNQNNIIQSVEKNIKLQELNEINFRIRMGFIRKVYGIVLIQLLLTFSFTCLSFFDQIKNFFKNNFFIIYIGLFLLLVTFFILAFKKEASKRVPLNYILLTTFTLATSIILICLCSYYTTEQVLIAWSATIAMSLGIIIISFCFKTKFHFVFALILIVLASLIFFGILIFFTKIIFKSESYVIFSIFSSLGAALYGLYLVFHTQMLVNEKVQVDTDKYIFASLQIYLDIILIFIHLLGSRR